MDKILNLLPGNPYKKEDEKGISYWRFIDGVEEKVGDEEIETARKNPAFLSAAKKEAVAELNRLADSYHNQISGASPQKLARYEAKAKAAAAYKAGQASDLDLALLQPEADERELALDAHVEAILKANAAFTSAAGVIEAFQAKGKLMIEQADSLEALEAIAAAIPAHAKVAFEEWQNSISNVAE